MTTYNTELNTLNSYKSTFNDALDGTDTQAGFKVSYENKTDNPSDAAAQTAFTAIDNILNTQLSSVQAMTTAYQTNTATLENELESVQNASSILLNDTKDKNQHLVVTNITLFVGICLFSVVTYRVFRKQ